MIEGTVDAESAFALAAKDLDPVALLGVTESVEVADVGDRAAMELTPSPPERRGEITVGCCEWE